MMSKAPDAQSAIPGTTYFVGKSMGDALSLRVQQAQSMTSK